MQASYSLEQYSVLVTGGASGIGLATVRAFLRHGASVAINDLPGEKLTSITEQLKAEGHKVLAAPADLSEPKAACAMVTHTIDTLGGLNVLVNNAGTPATRVPIAPADFDHQDEQLWSRLLGVNLLGPFYCTKAAASALQQSHGAIVNTASVSAFGGGGSSSPYCATKAALIALTREWSRALAPSVRVNAIAPGHVDSDWLCRFEGTDLELSDQVPLQRQGLPEEYAESIVFLAVGATYMTGQTMVIDGGMMS